MRPRTKCTKHMNNNYHHFRVKYVTRKEVAILSVDIKDQPGALFTKPLGEELLTKCLLTFMGWRLTLSLTFVE